MVKIKDIKPGDSGSYGLFPKMKVAQIKKDTVIMKVGDYGEKEVSYKLFERYFTPFR